MYTSLPVSLEFVWFHFFTRNHKNNCCCCSVTKSCLTLCNLMNYTACQVPLSSTISRCLLKFLSIELVMLPNHFHPLSPPFLPLPSILPSIRVFSNESAIYKWPKYWNFSFSISPFSEYSGLISFRIDWFNFL